MSDIVTIPQHTEPVPVDLNAQILDRIAKRRFTVSVIGLGYVGLPLALIACRAGFDVLGYDIDAQRVALLNRGETGILHLAGATLQEAVASGRFTATTDEKALAKADAILIAVPTPLTRQRAPDLSFIEQTAETIARSLRRGQLVVLESTTWPGTTIEIVKPILEKSGLKSGIDFFLAFSPEREDPGNTAFETSVVPKVVGGDGPVALEVAKALYDCLFAKTVPVSTPATAEAVKLTENIFRAVNIALVNELKLIYSKMGIDIWEVIDAAKTKPFGFMPFYPGPGLGGHCIPIDPFYLTWKAREFDISTRFIELAGEINTLMPYHVVDRLAEALDMQAGRGLNGSRILMIGIAYKKNVDDMRESPGLRLIELMESRGASVDYFDPFVPVIGKTREHARLEGRRSIQFTPEALTRYDAAVIATDHDKIDVGTLVEQSKLVVDTRNMCARRGIVATKIVKA